MILPHKNYNGDEVGRVAAGIQDWLAGRPVTAAVTLGSGLGGFGSGDEGAQEIGYDKIGLPMCGAEGHAGKLRWIPIKGNSGALILDGRVHLYEGHGVQEVVLGVRALTAVGAKIHILTCASGGITLGFSPGQIAVIKDHINLTGASPLVGSNDSKIGPRFPPMGGAYDDDLTYHASTVAVSLGIQLEFGTYAAMLGPTYETRAEVQMLKCMGADMAGMSTVPEAIALRHLGAKILGLSCVTNYATGVSGAKVSHEGVIDVAAQTGPTFRRLLRGIIDDLDGK